MVEGLNKSFEFLPIVTALVSFEALVAFSALAFFFTTTKDVRGVTKLY
jgi:hypothetical protein